MSDDRHMPRELHETHALVADELEGVIDHVLSLEREVRVEMFHGDEVNEEAALFANWAYKTLHDTIVPVRHELAVSPVAWLLSLPYAVEILGQTQVDVRQLDRGRHHRDLLQGLGDAPRSAARSPASSIPS